MNNYQHQTPSPVARHHHLPPPPPPHHSGLPHQNHHTTHVSVHHTPPSSVSVAAATQAMAMAAISLPHHQPLPQPPQHQQQQQQQQQPLISNSLAIRQEIQRFESVHPSIYAIYDLIDLLPPTDAQIAQQIRDHVVCIEEVSPEELGWILNSQAKKAVRNFMQQMPCGFPEQGIPPLAPYTNADMKLQLSKSVVDAFMQMIRFRFDGLDNMIIKTLKVSYTFNKKVKYHFIFPELKAKAQILNTDTFFDMLRQLGLQVRYEGTGPLEFTLKNLSIKGQFKYKMPWLIGSIKIYKFEATVTLGSVESNIGGILGNGNLNRFINDQIEEAIPAFINGNQKEISKRIEETVVPTVNAKLKGHKIWYLLGQLGNSNKKCYPTPAPW